MWRRLRRRTMAPQRPAVFPEQWALLVVSLTAIVAGIVVVAAWLS